MANVPEKALSLFFSDSLVWFEVFDFVHFFVENPNVPFALFL